MSYTSEHCADCKKELGKEYRKVHIWLDELYAFLGPKHRSARHHKEGVEQVREMWGDEAAKAAEIHICKDWSWHPDYDGSVPTRQQAELWTVALMDDYL